MREAWARIGHSQPERAGLNRRQPENAETAPHRVCAGEAPSSWLMCESPLTESNRRPSPYHGDALPTELRGQVFSLSDLRLCTSRPAGQVAHGGDTACPDRHGITDLG